jgi:hypothetical protein
MMAKDSEAAREEQAAGWRERIKELTSPGNAQQESATPPDEGSRTDAQRSSGGSQQESSQSQSPEPESARDFIQRKMREEKNKGEL